MEPNKFIISRTNKSTPLSYYRSVKYKVVLSNAEKMNRTFSTIPNTSNILNQNCKQSWKKPNSNSKHRQVNSSLHAEMPEENAEQDIKTSYLSTWDQLLSSSDKNQTTKKQESKLQSIRVHLPSIIDFEPSKFTSLDPLFLPFDDVQRGIDELKLELPVPKKQMAKIHYQMINFKQKILNQLESTQKYGMSQFKRLRDLLKADSVEYQQGQMRLRRQCLSLKDEDESYRCNFSQTKPRLNVLQDDLFSCRPFNLINNQDFEQQFPQQYF